MMKQHEVTPQHHNTEYQCELYSTLKSYLWNQQLIRIGLLLHRTRFVFFYYLLFPSVEKKSDELTTSTRL